jgi:guanylate kinase
MKKSNIFIISGPSGAGEDSIIEGLKKFFKIERIVTTTTRAMRSKESQGNPYCFISRENFIARRDSNEFVEWAEQYNGNLYGVTKKEIERVKNSGHIGTWKIEWKGVMTAKKIFPEIISIFINAPLAVLENRIHHRDNVSEGYIKERMKYTEEWLNHKNIYDYEIINEEGKLEETIKKVADIIKKHSPR